MNNLYKEMVRKPGDLCFEVSLESDKGLTMTDLSFALKFFVYGHPKNVCIHKDDLKVVEGKYYAVLNEHGFVNGVLFCEAEIVETINGINRIVSVRSNTGYMIGNCCEQSVDTSSCAHGYSLSLYKVEYVPQPIDPNPEEDQLVAEELFGERLSLPELTADRAIADEHGNRIADTYETRQAVRNHIRAVYNEQFNENPPLIMDGYITPQMLSESTKELLENTGQAITNVPDGEDLTTKQGVLKLSDKPYNPGAYSGLGRVYLRKNLVGGQNLLTQAMVSKPNTIYIIQYDYTLDGKSITIPEGCVLSYEGGSIRDGHINYTDTLIKGIVSLNNVIETGNVKYYPLRADEEDLTTEGGKYFKFADKQYDSSNHSGHGRIYLRKNMVEDKNILTQEMISKPNTIYIIQYDYDLNGTEITIPEGCVLDFQGGSFSNGTLIGNNTKISIENIKIFDNILLKGKFDNRIDVRMYGLVASESTYSPVKGSDNTNILNNFIIPSATNIKREIYFPSKIYAFNGPLAFNGTYNIICDGTLTYNGPNDTTFITIGDVNKRNDHHDFKFDIIGIRPESERNNIFAIRFINISNANIIIKRVTGFSYGIELMGDGYGAGYNEFYPGRIEGDVCALRFISKGDLGWVNQNYVYAGYFLSLKGCGIWLCGEGYHYTNSNHFYGSSVENSEIGVRLTHANNNYIKDGRFESVRLPIDIVPGSTTSIGGGRSVYNIITYTTEGKSITDDAIHNGTNRNFYFSSVERYKNLMTTLYDDYYILYRKGSNYELASSLTSAYISNDYSEGMVAQEIGTKVSNAENLLVGFVVDLSKAQYYELSLGKHKTSEQATNNFYAAILDDDYKFINIEDNFDLYIDKFSTDFSLDNKSNKYLITNTSKNPLSCSIRFKTNNTLAFIGFKCLNGQNLVKLQAYSNKNPIVYPYPVNAMSFTPDAILRVPCKDSFIGNSIYNTTINKSIWWTGEKWVDATGTEV